MHIDAEELLEPTAFATMTGTLSQVQSRLKGSQAQRVIALTFDHASESNVNAIADTVASIAPLVGEILLQRQQGNLRQIVDALVPHMPLPEHMVREARGVAQARKAVLEAGPWLTAANIAELAGFSATNPSAQPNKWKKDGLVFAIHHLGRDYFPGYALDVAANYRPAKAMADIIRVLADSKDAWGMATWFAAANSVLGSQRPQDVLAQSPEQVLKAAQDEVLDIAHG